MKNENKSIYYGILFFFLYDKIYEIFSSIVISPILSMQWNIYLVPILLLLIIIMLSVIFYRIKEFPKIRIWHILLVVFLSTLISFFNIPGRFYFTGGNSVYSPETQYTILNYIRFCVAINMMVFLAISYFKYWKLQDPVRQKG